MLARKIAFLASRVAEWIEAFASEVVVECSNDEVLDGPLLDIWLEVIHLARNEKPGETVRFTLHSMSKRLQSTVHTGNAKRA